MPIPDHLNKAIDHFLSGQATEAEKQAVREWFQAQFREEVIVEAPAGYTEEDLFARMKGRLDTVMLEDRGKGRPDTVVPEDGDKGGLNTARPDDGGISVPVVHRVHFLRTSWFRYAAILLLLFAGTYFWLRQTSRPALVKAASIPLSPANILPGGNKAILTLDDGSSIVLEQATDGSIAKQGVSNIIKRRDGQLIYDSKAVSGHSGDIGYNTVTTPKGGQYQVILPDGSMVWLNAASSIRFPTSFKDTGRAVTVVGEAYFEIAANKNSPFRVTANGTEVTVLGTSFNVNAYRDEADVRTTLLKGKVRVMNEQFSALLAPGQQASTGAYNAVREADTASVVAWKNGFFDFRSADLGMLMRQLSRWYDVDVRVNGVLPKRDFSGQIQRDLNLGQVLDILKEMEVHFKMEGRTLVLMP